MIVCKMFGHKPGLAYASRDIIWVEIDAPYYDGINRAHRTLWAKCDRCNRRYQIARTIDLILSCPDKP